MKKDAFFDKLNALGLAVTYDDVRLKTGYYEYETIHPGPTHSCVQLAFSLLCVSSSRVGWRLLTGGARALAGRP